VKLHLAYHSEKTNVAVHDESVEVKAFQIIVWMSISPDPLSDWDPRTLRFPAILDIGHNHNFAMTENHLLKWAGLQVNLLTPLGNVRERGERILLRRAGLWLHMDDEPFKLDVAEGISVHTGDWPRLPVLGLRALSNSKLQTFIYGDTRQALIRTPPPWYWPF
jgi:hypothetical protein